MVKRHFILTHDQTAALRHAEVRTKDGSTRTRYPAVRLYGSGYQVAHVPAITSCSRTSLMDWCRRYRIHGVAGLVDGRIGGNRAQLTSDQRHLVRAKLHQYTPRHLFGPETATADGPVWTVPDRARAVRQWVGVTWDSPRSYAARLAACGFTYQRTQKVFKSRREPDMVTFEEHLEKNGLTLPKTDPKQCCWRKMKQPCTSKQRRTAYGHHVGSRPWCGPIRAGRNRVSTGR